MVCHGELARLKPDPRHLTSFYMMISLGGTLGGVFVAIIAPHVFHTYFELPLVDGGLQRAGRDRAVDLAARIGRARSRLLRFASPCLRSPWALAIHLGYEKHLAR